MKKQVDGNGACSRIAYIFSEICSIYPITPSSPMAANVDYLTHTDLENIFNSKPKVIEMQSEAGAAGALHGALLSGSLASTFTASQGLLLMIPNMYKIAGEGLPGVIHVASRTIATHALSIFGDHSDIYATRNTGFCMLCSSNVEEAQNLAAVAHLSAIKGSLPFLHFFDGFRTSHELNTIEELKEEDLIKLIPWEDIEKFKKRSLNVSCGKEYGMAENEDIYFQSVEARNNDYKEIPDIVNDYMQKINKIQKTEYAPFNYYGAKDAENIIIAMGSVCDTAKLVVAKLVNTGQKVGVITVRLYRPFSETYLKNVIPTSVKTVAVLDRTKEPGSVGEPLYLDVVSALKDRNIQIVGGRYGLSSKNTTPEDIFSVFEMLKGEVKNNFTIGINDDVTNLSLKKYNFEVGLDAREMKIYGFGSDGMVSASKEILKIMAADDLHVQGYFEYDSKKSGGVTVSNLRWSKNPIHAPFYVMEPEIVVVTKEEYLHKFSVLKDIKNGGILLLNTSKEQDELNNFLPNNLKEEIQSKNIKVIYIDASKIAILNNIPGKISKIMEVIILKLLNIENYINKVEKKVKEAFITKGEDVINNNISALNSALDSLKVLNNIRISGKDLENDKNVFDLINERKGNNLPVSALMPFKNGGFPWDLAKYEKRNTSYRVPIWDINKCVQCGMCNIVCPHGVIKHIVTKDNIGKPCNGKEGYNFAVLISEADCTGCGVCINNCPTKALSFGAGSKENLKLYSKYNDYQNPELFPKTTIKGASLCETKFKFSGACAGCGETSYIKLLTQIYGDELVIANATGCSSIYGGSAPSTPYSIPWANSLFEDNAEFAFGIHESFKNKRNQIENIMKLSINSVTEDVKKLYTEWLENKEDVKITTRIKNELQNKEIPKQLTELIDYIPSRVVWAVGGDGWAYDIGFGGLDHVLSQNENIKCLVLDTEVYSNTGGQTSKSSNIGAVAEFADFGKKTYKKDLFRIAMSYPNCYVASISLGSNVMHTIKVFKEAMEHKGPAIIIAYSPCVEHGIKNGMGCSIKEGKLAVEVGYQLLMRYNPDEDKLYIDSKEPDFDRYEEFLSNEVRFNALKIKDKDLAKRLLGLQKENAIKRYNFYKKIQD